MKKYLLLGFLLFPLFQRTYASAPANLTQLFQKNFNNFYNPRLCNDNIRRLLEAAKVQGIDTSESIVLKVSGLGFLNTSGFYTRGKVDQWATLGIAFHYVLLAEGKVFDFDLSGGRVLTLEKYIRLQFMPPTEPFIVFGLDYTKNRNPDGWEVTAYEPENYRQYKMKKLWKKKMKSFVDLKSIRKLKRSP